MATTKVSFKYSKEDLFDKVKSWAKENGFKIQQSSDSFMFLKKGGYWSWNAHPSVMIEKNNDTVNLECWINPIWGGKMEVTSDNFVGIAAKVAARKPINKLLEIFDVKPLT
jgi:hypothetical protein